jgi:hypothetical protein
MAIAADRPSVYLDLEAPADRARLSDPNLYLATHEAELVILDEVQRTADLFQILRGLIDDSLSRSVTMPNKRRRIILALSAHYSAFARLTGPRGSSPCVGAVRGAGPD